MCEDTIDRIHLINSKRMYARPIADHNDIYNIYPDNGVRETTPMCQLRRIDMYGLNIRVDNKIEDQYTKVFNPCDKYNEILMFVIPASMQNGISTYFDIHEYIEEPDYARYIYIEDYNPIDKGKIVFTFNHDRKTFTVENDCMVYGCIAGNIDFVNKPIKIISKTIINDQIALSEHYEFNKTYGEYHVNHKYFINGNGEF